MEMVKERVRIKKADVTRAIERFINEDIIIGDMVIERYRDDTVIIVRTNDGKRWLEQRIEVSE